MRLFNKHYKSPPRRNPSSLAEKAAKEREKIAKAIRRPIKGSEKGAKGETYSIDIKKTKKGYYSQVVMPDGYKSAKLGPFKGKDALNKAYAHANFLGAAFTGSEDFIKHPEKRSKLEAHMKKGMPKAKKKAKKNPAGWKLVSSDKEDGVSCYIFKKGNKEIYTEVDREKLSLYWEVNENNENIVNREVPLSTTDLLMDDYLIAVYGAERADDWLKEHKKNPKKNPAGGGRKRKPIGHEEQFTADLEAVWGIPADSQEAYRVGYYEGVVRGIDTCGVQNYFKRKKIRKNYEKELLEAREEAQARVLSGGSGPTSYSGRRGGGRTVI